MPLSLLQSIPLLRKGVWHCVFLACAIAVLWQLSVSAESPPRFVANYQLRNPDYPRTYIESIQLDLTSPDHFVRLTWVGPRAEGLPTGPFKSCPGAGLGNNDCNDEAESQRNGSNCTPKGERLVEGFRDSLRDGPSCHYVTWFDKVRAIGFHSHWSLPDYPASHGCVRMKEHAAQLIHNNSVEGQTKVIVTGTWVRR